jgi:hypothetical protein
VISFFFAAPRKRTGLEQAEIVTRIWSDILGFGRMTGEGVVGFGWTRLDWVGLAWTLLRQKRYGGQAERFLSRGWEMNFDF